MDIAHYRLLNARKKAEENGASQEELDALQKDIDDNRAKYKQVAKAKKKLNQQRAKERKLYGDPNEERRDHISDLFTWARLSYDKPDLHFVGTGEGAQVYGWGHYSSGVKDVARDEYAMRYVGDYKRGFTFQYKGEPKTEIDFLGHTANTIAKLHLVVGHVDDAVWDAIWDGEKITQDKSGDFIIGDKTIPKDALLFVATDQLGILKDEDLFDVWGGKVVDRDFRSVDYYNIAKSMARVDNPEIDKVTKFYIAALRSGPLKNAQAWASFVDKFLPKMERLEPKEQPPRPAVMQQTWWTHRPAGDESHLLNWFEDISEENFQSVAMAAKDAGATEAELDDLGDSVRTGGDAYEWLGRFFEKKGMTNGEAKKAASEALYAHDIDGVKYPVAAFHNPANQDGRKGWNYVAFSDEHLRVDHVYEYNPETDDFERKWHETRGAGSRFTETPLGQELVAHAFDVLVGVDADLLLRPWHYGEKREPGKGLVTAGLGRELDMTDEKGFAAEVSARISRFGTREGDPTLREIRARCGSKERFYEVLGAVFEAAVGLKLGVQDVITQREFGTMEKRMPLYAWVIRHNAQARATALGRKAYIMGRAFAERLHKEALAEARAEVERQRAKASEARAQTREAKAQTRNAERREETARIKLKKAEFSAAEADFIARWRLAEERAISRMRRTCNKSECIKGRKGPVKGC